MRRFGSGEITVRAVKFVLLPSKLPRKRPCLPDKRCNRPRINLCSWTSGSPECWELIRRAISEWRLSNEAIQSGSDRSSSNVAAWASIHWYIWVKSSSFLKIQTTTRILPMYMCSYKTLEYLRPIFHLRNDWRSESARTNRNTFDY